MYSISCTIRRFLSATQWMDGVPIVNCLLLSHANYSGNDDIDAFSFVLALPHQSSFSRCEMCISYSVSEGIFWDNNGGANYLLEWVPIEEKPVKQTSPVLSRLPSFLSSSLSLHSQWIGRWSTFSDNIPVEWIL
ncbi:hypothetical protein PMAYCL1PPCAC_01026 [Pristionchus mayeri]|uniref:CBM21 domain-containing protein n=1 Tax=Pristionchus mayeri TaxID=1317129 RepID=A0AAN5C700_9BILA|nr:hypothetical protein PMAYCL1PPCAC_01026 [Pristionchus mayeri]